MTTDTQTIPVARQVSTRLVMEAVVRSGPISRAEIARSTGLSKQTISEVMRELEADGWVREQGQVQGAVGRSAVAYELQADAAFVLGIDLGGTKLHLALADLTGEIVADMVEPTALGTGMQVVEQIGRMAEALGARIGSPRERIRYGAMGSPGVVEPATGAIKIAPNIPGLDAIDVPGSLRRRLGFPVLIENDVNLAATGELWRGNSREAATFAFIALGTGIGMGLFADGRLIRGSRGAAGEIAYLPLGGDPFDARSLRFGTLETAVSSAAITERYAGLGGAPGTTVRTIFDRIEEDAAAAATIDEVARIVASAIVAVHSVIDPELVVLGGSIGARPELKARIEPYLARCMSEPVSLAVSALGSRATLIGAVGAALGELHRTLFGIGAPTAMPARAQPQAGTEAAA